MKKIKIPHNVPCFSLVTIPRAFPHGLTKPLQVAVRYSGYREDGGSGEEGEGGGQLYGNERRLASGW